MSKNKIKAGYQGVPGSFSQQALIEYFALNIKHFTSDIEEHNFPDFEDVFIALQNGTIEYGILPIENSSTGGISETYKLLLKYDCHIVGERCIKVDQHLLGIKGAKLKDITQVYSHPQGYEQSSLFFKKHPNITFTPYKNTAESARYIDELGKKNVGAIASRKAAEIYNLDILAENINFNNQNITRFAIIGKNPEITDACNKISIVMTVAHTPGSLYKALSFFEKSNINLTKIESRPLIDRPWEYFFYLDFLGNMNNADVQKALENVKTVSSYLRVFGNYVAHDVCIDEKEKKMANNTYGLIGEKLSHSYSPRIHSLIMEALKSDGNYNLYETEKDGLSDLILKLKSMNTIGVNVTIPYKVEVMQYLNNISPQAKAIGAVNTIVFNKDSIDGYNTDYDGFKMMLKRFDIDACGKAIVVLGSGGAAKSVVQSLLDSNVEKIHIITLDKAPDTEFYKNNKIEFISYDVLSQIKKDIIINCTPCGMYPNTDASPVNEEQIAGAEAVVDLIYNPSRTLLMKTAEKMNIKNINGLYMLVAQAVRAQEIWNKVTIDEKIIDQIYETLCTEF